MEQRNNRVLLAIIQIIIACGIGVAVFADTRHAIYYGVIGLVILAFVHWKLREKVKQDGKFLVFVILAFAAHFILRHYGSNNETATIDSVSTLGILSYVPVVLVFIAILFLVVKQYKLTRK